MPLAPSITHSLVTHECILPAPHSSHELQARTSHCLTQLLRPKHLKLYLQAHPSCCLLSHRVPAHRMLMGAPSTQVLRWRCQSPWAVSLPKSLRHCGGKAFLPVPSPVHQQGDSCSFSARMTLEGKASVTKNILPFCWRDRTHVAHFPARWVGSVSLRNPTQDPPCLLPGLPRHGCMARFFFWLPVPMRGCLWQGSGAAWGARLSLPLWNPIFYWGCGAGPWWSTELAGFPDSRSA